MKSPSDSVVAGVSSVPAGGKALARLRQFSEERGIISRINAAAAPAGGSSDSSYAQNIAAAVRVLAAAPPAGVPTWSFLGPNSILNGQTYGASKVTVSGRISAIAIDPSNANHLLAGSAAGGIWESSDSGATWVARTDAMPTLTIGAIAYDPTNSANVYAGSGEGNWYSYMSQGVFKSTNGGSTWAVVGTNPFVGEGFFDLKVDPASPNHLLAATTIGAYSSADGGATWTQMLAGTCWKLAVTPGREILAATNGGVQQSTDGGATWSGVALPGMLPASWQRLAVDISPSNPSVAYIFGADSANNGFLYARSAAGAWTQLTLPPDLKTTQCWYDWFVAVSPQTENSVYLGAIDTHRGDFSGGAWSWTNISTKAAGDSIHPDQHAIAFDPTNASVVYIGCDGGLFRSPDSGVTWQDLNPGLGITEIEYIAQSYNTSQWIIAGTQDNGSDRYTGDPNWTQVAEGDGGDCAVNHTNPSSVFHSFYNMGLEHSADAGDTWTAIGPYPPAGYASQFYPPLGINGDTVAQAGQSAFISRDDGTTWFEAILPANMIATAIHLPSPNRVYIGCKSGDMYRIDWSGAAWSAAVALTPPLAGAFISDIAEDPSNAARIWVTSSTTGGGRFFRSDDSGATWADLSAGLPNLPINAVEVDSATPTHIWAGADIGVYQSLDAGATWGALSMGLPNVLIEDLDFNPTQRLLRAGTRSRGCWQLAV